MERVRFDHPGAQQRGRRDRSALSELFDALQTAVSILSHLGGRFSEIAAELQRDDLTEALEALDQAALRVCEIGQTYRLEASSFDQLREVSGTLTERVLKMSRSVRTADALAVNARIAAAAIAGSGVDFASFADEVARTLDMTHAGLGRIRTELRSVHQRAVSAHGRQSALGARQDQAARSIQQRLAASVAEIARQQQRAAQACNEVESRSESVRDQVASAVTALQIGDATRQRIEHVTAALALSSEPGSSIRLLRANCQLQSMQLTDAVDSFLRNGRDVASSLIGLADAAKGLRGVATGAFGDGDGAAGSAIAKVKDQVNEAVGLFRLFADAQAQSGRTVSDVSAATGRLARYLTEVQSLEGDIRILALNTTLRCSRLGTQGMALGMVAQELRAYANTFAREADAVLREVGTVGAIAESLRNASELDAAAELDRLAAAMQGALPPLQRTGAKLADAVAELDQESVRLTKLLEEAAHAIGSNDRIGEAMQDAARLLEASNDGVNAPFADLAEEEEALLDRIAGWYTMADERAVHARALGRPVPVAEEPVSAGMDDFLF